MKIKVNNLQIENSDYIIKENTLTLTEEIDKGDMVSMSYECNTALNRKQRRDIEFGRKVGIL